jgi:hypothetical protein
MNPDYRLLRQWLQLEPEGAWPPSAEELLGLPKVHSPPASALSPAEIEARVLERLDWLRPYQLKYPELVTEGMNRLAQAFLACTQGQGSHAARYPSETSGATAANASDISEGVPQTTAAVGYSGAEKEPAELVAELNPPTLEFLEEEGLPVAESALAAHGTQEVPVSQDIPVSVASRPALSLPPPLPVPPSLTSSLERFSYWQSRRKLYRRLVRLRRLWHAWREVGEILAASTLLDRPLPLLRFHQVHRRLRENLAQLGEVWSSSTTPNGAQAAALLRHEHAVQLLRWLEPEQRLRFLLDWRRGEQHLATLYQQLRTQLQTERQSRQRRNRFLRSLGRLACQPESILVAVIALALLILWLRPL